MLPVRILLFGIRRMIYRIARTKSGASVSVRIPIQAKGQTKETS